MYLLYLWEILHRHDLLGSALQTLNNNVSATNGANGVPSVINRSANNDDNDLLSDKTTPTSTGGSVIASLGKSIEKHGQSLIEVAKIDADKKVMLAKMQEKKEVQAQLVETVRKLKGEKRLLLIQYRAEVVKGNKALADTIMAQVNDIELDIIDTNNKIEMMQETTKKRNRNTPESADN